MTNKREHIRQTLLDEAGGNLLHAFELAVDLAATLDGVVSPGFVRIKPDHIEIRAPKAPPPPPLDVPDSATEGCPV
jgi:hypothetical protein